MIEKIFFSRSIVAKFLNYRAALFRISNDYLLPNSILCQPFVNKKYSSNRWPLFILICSRDLSLLVYVYAERASDGQQNDYSIRGNIE